MIESLHDIHKGSTISIVASGPSAVMYDGFGDIAIGVNGASLLGPTFDYYMCGDPYAHRHDWFSINCSKERVVAKVLASMDYQLYPEHIYDIERKSVTVLKQRALDLPDPVYPHKTFRYRSYKHDKLRLNNKFLLFGGTISCCALQLAWMMGADRVVLFGCNFRHSMSEHHFYDTKMPGRVVLTQVKTMQSVIDKMRTAGLVVSIIGKSALS